jgi:hypothetical protein
MVAQLESLASQLEADAANAQGREMVRLSSLAKTLRDKAAAIR